MGFVKSTKRKRKKRGKPEKKKYRYLTGCPMVKVHHYHHRGKKIGIERTETGEFQLFCRSFHKHCFLLTFLTFEDKAFLFADLAIHWQYVSYSLNIQIIYV